MEAQRSVSQRAYSTVVNDARRDLRNIHWFSKTEVVTFTIEILMKLWERNQIAFKEKCFGKLAN